MDRRNGTERRRKTRVRVATSGPIVLWLEDAKGAWSQTPAEAADKSEDGIGILLALHLKAGTAVMVEGGDFFDGSGGRRKGVVCWCRPTTDGRFRAGLSFDLARSPTGREGDFVDFYEIMELSPQASIDVIHKVYRMLASRLHPDNEETGSEEQFKLLVKAFRTLSDPQERAAFDAERNDRQSKFWRVFDQVSAVPSLEQERAKRRGVLSILYVKKMREPGQPGTNIQEMEALLNIPREHLEFTIWFLREQGWIVRTDNGRFSITSRGVEHAEESGTWDNPAKQTFPMLEAAHQG